MIPMEDNKALKAELLVIRDKPDSAGVCWALFTGAAASGYSSRRDVTDLYVLVKEDFGKARKALKRVVNLDVAGSLKLNVAGSLFFLYG
jgi:hypothetical protein